MTDTIVTETHTPGPWTFSRRVTDSPESFIAYIKADSDHREIAVLYSDDDQLANASLIAAAPDLLLSAKAILDWWDRGGPMDVEFIKGFAAPLRDAIAKAEGRAA